MTTSFINETTDNELQLNDLQQLNGGGAQILIPWGIGLATGAMAGGLAVFGYYNREQVADALHDLISKNEDSGDGVNCDPGEGDK